jgi:lysophospholipase L1-like esterase
MTSTKALAAALVLGLAGALGASASAGPVAKAPRSYYLALGDSIAYGFQTDKADAGLPPFRFNTGYVDVFAARLRTIVPRISVVNYGCPGESTRTFIHGGCPGRGDVQGLHDGFEGAQLDAALAFLRAHPGEVSPITVTLWGGDLYGEFAPKCKGDLPCIRSHASAGLTRFGSRLASIVARLRAAAPNAEIILSGAWNFDVEHLAQSDPLFRSIDATIAQAAARGGARVATIYPLFGARGDAAKAKARICALTFICSKGDPHPTDAGYRVMAGAFLAASGYARRP